MILSDDQKNKYLRIGEYIDKSANILVVTHQYPDGDAVGSLVAMMEYLYIKGKQHTIFVDNGIQESFPFFKNSYKMTTDEKSLEKNNFDLAIVLDCSSLDYTGIKNYFMNESCCLCKTRLITMDHHLGNENYGEFNLVDVYAASTSIILYKLFVATKKNITKEAATGILLGILTDTSNFTNDATNAEAFEVAAELIGRSGRYNNIIKQVFHDKNQAILKIWGRVLSRLVKNDKLNIAYSVLLEDDIQTSGKESLDGVSNFFNNLGDVSIAMILKEKNDGKIRVSLRGIQKGINVLKFARFFQGGGHQKAAGFSIRGRLEKVGNYWQVV